MVALDHTNHLLPYGMAATPGLALYVGSAAGQEEMRLRELHLGLPTGFLDRLLKSDDDWTFVLRLHALFEAAIAHLVSEQLNDGALASWVDGLSIRGPASKSSLGKALGVITKEEDKLIEVLARIRSAFAHDVGMTCTSLVEYFQQMDQGARSSAVAHLGASLLSSGHPTEAGDIANTLLLRPRIILWLAASPLITRAYEVRRAARSKAINEEFGLTTEDGRHLTTEDGRSIVREDAPGTDDAY